MRIDPCPHCGERVNIVSDHGWGCPSGPADKLKRFRRDVRRALREEGGWHVAAELAPIVHADPKLVKAALYALCESGLAQQHPASNYHFKIKQGG